MITKIKSGVTEMVSFKHYYKMRKLHYDTDVINDYSLDPKLSSNYFLYVKNNIKFNILPIDRFEDSVLFINVFIKHGKNDINIDWDDRILWPDDVEPVLSNYIDMVDVLTFMSIDGNVWMGFITGLGYSVEVIPDLAYDNENPYKDTEWPGTYEWQTKYPHRNFSRKRWWSYIFGDD